MDFVESFGPFVSKAIQSKKTETQLLGFKETLPMWRMKNGPDKERAKQTFAEDVASLANARGDVLVIGITEQIGFPFCTEY